jgi:hypothetical protein
LCAGVEIYSFETAAWIYKESEWSEETDVTFSRSSSVFINGCLHIMENSVGYFKMLAVDMEGNTWRKIDRPSGLQHSMHQAQGYLCVRTFAGPTNSKLLI